MGQLCMVEFKRLLDKRFAIIILIVSVVSIILFYQFNKITILIQLKQFICIIIKC